jgi:hypothetical protein
MRTVDTILETISIEFEALVNLLQKDLIVIQNRKVKEILITVMYVEESNFTIKD